MTISPQKATINISLKIPNSYGEFKLNYSTETQKTTLTHRGLYNVALFVTSGVLGRIHKGGLGNEDADIYKDLKKGEFLLDIHTKNSKEEVELYLAVCQIEEKLAQDFIYRYEITITDLETNAELTEVYTNEKIISNSTENAK